jgi:hypothetical protein
LLEQIQKSQGSAKERQRLFNMKELFDQPIDFETAILADHKSIVLEIREKPTHATERRKRRVVRMLHQEDQSMPRQVKIVPTS